MCWTKTDNKKEHVMCISRLETLGDHKPEIGNRLAYLKLDFFFTTQQCLRNAIMSKTVLSRDTWLVERAGIEHLNRIEQLNRVLNTSVLDGKKVD